MNQDKRHAFRIEEDHPFWILDSGFGIEDELEIGDWRLETWREDIHSGFWIEDEEFEISDLKFEI